MVHAKAQVSTEFIVVMSGIFIVIAALVSSNLEILSAHENNVRVTKARDAIDSIHKAAEHVYMQGEHSKTQIFVMIPNGVESITLSDNLIEINLSVSGVTRNVFRTTRFSINGTIPIEEGYYWLNIISRGTYVDIE